MKTKFFLISVLFITVFSSGYAQIAINTTGAIPDASAGLDVSFTNKGMLIPRVALTQTTSSSPITTPIPSLLVYNTATASSGATAVYPGYYYWNGTKWIALSGGNGGNDWGLLGNAGTIAGTNFLGTTDAVDLTIYTNNIERLRVSSTGLLGINTAPAGAYLKILSNNSSMDGLDAFHTSGSTVSAFNAIQGNVTNVAYTTATGYLAYHNSNNKTFSVYGNGGDLAGMFNGRVGINSVSTSLTNADLEIRNTTTANPVYVFLRATEQKPNNNDILTNLDFGDSYITSPQARIQIFRDAAASSITDLPTSITFWTMADAASSLVERMRITSGGLVGINMTPSMQLDVTSSTINVGDATIRGASTGNGAVYGVKGSITSTTSTAAGIFGLASGTSGQTHGVLGQTYSTSDNSSGVRGYAGGTSGVNFGVWGENTSNTANATGVFGMNSSTTAEVNGVWGNTVSTAVGASGVYASSTGGSGTYGLYAINTGANGNGIRGVCNNGPTAIGVWGQSTIGYSGYFNGPGLGVDIVGNLNVTGTVTKGGGSFKIDHPLDPANKYLIHSFVESPDMMNIYNGNIVTNADGEATVKLPSYFQAENMDYKYQLTVIGQFAQAIVMKEISNNQFIIKTDKPNVKVSWQVTGIRNDKWAQKFRIPTEVEKNENEKGKYLYPELYGFGEDMSIDKVKHPDRGEKTLPDLSKIK